MKKILFLPLIFVATLLFGNNLDQKDRQDVQSVNNQYFYLALNATPMKEYPTYYFPEVGYRFQRNKLGFDVNLGVNGRTHDYFIANLALNFLVFPKPNLASQFYLGLGVNSGFSSTIQTGYFTFTRNNYVGSYTITETRKVPYSYRYNTFLFYPAIFIGKDFSVSNGKKLFGEILFIPVSFEKKPVNWDWETTLAFRVGYGF
ncbi:MAG: hypothetical protein KDK63_03805 [Chlamydiia bacterium]|nr:hypothetical protein [Chlamydiia bacterium]MCB1116354.1 hypothetical protein [Chlamydiia bacterium]